jgi:hypothetical protein
MVSAPKAKVKRRTEGWRALSRVNVVAALINTVDESRDDRHVMFLV